MPIKHATPYVIELNLSDMSQLFNTMDASPFRGKDLADGAEELIVTWAHEYNLRDPVALRIHLDKWPEQDPTQLICDAVHNYFIYRAKLTALEFKRLMRLGRFSLLIGVIFLAGCLMLSALLDRSAGTQSGTVADYLRQSLTIGGWVAMWRPMEIYLYDWWPIWRHRRNYTRLSRMPIEVVRTATKEQVT